MRPAYHHSRDTARERVSRAIGVISFDNTVQVDRTGREHYADTMTGYRNYRPVHEHMAEVTLFHKRTGRLPKGGKMVGAEERAAHRSLTAVRRAGGIPAHWLSAVTDTFTPFVEELAAWMAEHNGLFPRNRPGTEEGRLRHSLNVYRRTAPSKSRRQLLDERTPGWNAERLNIGDVNRVAPYTHAALHLINRATSSGDGHDSMVLSEHERLHRTPAGRGFHRN